MTQWPPMCVVKAVGAMNCWLLNSLLDNQQLGAHGQTPRRLHPNVKNSFRHNHLAHVIRRIGAWNGRCVGVNLT
jgi:hypothetical protein